MCLKIRFQKKVKWFYFCILLIGSACLLWAGCAVEPSSELDQEQKLIDTAAAETAFFQATEYAQKTETALPLFTPTFTLIPATETMVVEPTLSAMPTQTMVSPTEVPENCNRVTIIGDVSVEPGTVLFSEENFHKIWRLRNDGACAWTGEYKIVFLDGEQMNGPDKVSLNTVVLPGETIDISLTLTSPRDRGTYLGWWKLETPSGELFGPGDDGEGALSVHIEVSLIGMRDKPNVIFDFSRDYLMAYWQSSAGTPLISSNGNRFGSGYVTRYVEPILEGGYQENEPTLVMVPNDGENGMISGKFPPVAIESGDYFQAWVGCLDDSPWCDVVFLLDYSIDGQPMQNLGSWEQTYDEEWEYITVDLTALKGHEVEFSLAVDSKGFSKDDRAFWLLPVILGQSERE